jgi:ketosteroid isomerase-like protein
MQEGFMRQYVWLAGAMALLAAACGPSANIEQERNTLLQRDREWSQTPKDLEKFISYFAPDASAYPQGMPIAKGTDSIRKTFTAMSSMPGFSIQWTPAKADVSSAGDIGYTAGTYEATMNGAAEKGKYVTVWKKQSDGQWKVSEDIFNADAAPNAPASQPVMVAAGAVTWGDAPPSLPPGSQMAVVSGDPTQAQPFVVRARLPPGYRIAPHWHPTDEHITVLAGTVSLGMGDAFDQSAMKDLSAGGYTSVPADMHHFFMAKTAATIQVHGMGPFAVNYVNPADDPSKQKK